MTRWYESTDHMEDRAVLLDERLGPEARARLHSIRPESDPEERFTELVRQHLRADDIVVDIGSGDGSWLMMNVAPVVRRVVGLDYSARRVWLASQQRALLDGANADLLLTDARRIPLRDGVADAIINRRGPWIANGPFFAEGLRILRPGGLAFEISIGEQNACELNKAFRERSQMYEWQRAGTDGLAEHRTLHERASLELVVAESHVVTELFPSREALEYRLMTSPAVEGFDREADAPLVDRVVVEHGGPDGVRLTVHRLCLVVRRSA